ncbi:hypothetical protein [Enterococcus faecalis]|uniref:hypothetical protein n=1 Tax=Enterococcus TaxID=1350 RepID=UPI000F7FBFB3|nr:hypothetical protein [Enterococcus faecalis]EGO6570119.1 hypothetical protein [Enterococcus faecalis]EGO6689888.1 hypothetical protein [Enterococcus faecalis]EGO7756674.1 hypothetical protein [Enterococcus faecalis]EGO8279966.1 hypothetical protein [Enterococcus faecalis]EGO8519998.1 hypothetical protein [Enterococcus faecalis]
MNEKIVGLLQELQEECKKAELPIVCGIVEKDTDTNAALIGGLLSEQSLILYMLTELFKKAVENATCNCSNCTAYTLSDAKRNADFYNKNYDGEWKILKYGRPITMEVQHG